MSSQSYESYGIERVWVERMKKKAKEPRRKERLKELAEDLTRQDLQNRKLVSELVEQGLKILGEKRTALQKDQITAYVLDQKIDPDNMIQLIKLWNRLR